MTRTTIMLPRALKTQAMKLAKQRGISLGELIRTTLAATLGQRAADRGAPFWSDEATFKGEVPDDLSQAHDDYLYGVTR